MRRSLLLLAAHEPSLPLRRGPSVTPVATLGAHGRIGRRGRTREGVSRVYPKLANDLSVGGHVTLSCRIDSRGLVERCRVAAETTADFKVGAAAMRLTPMFRFRPVMTITGPMPPMVNVPIRFVPPPDDIRRAIPFAALLAASTTALRWYRDRIKRLVVAVAVGPISEV